MSHENIIWVPFGGNTYNPNYCPYIDVDGNRIDDNFVFYSVEDLTNLDIGKNPVNLQIFQSLIQFTQEKIINTTAGWEVHGGGNSEPTNFNHLDCPSSGQAYLQRCMHRS